MNIFAIFTKPNEQIAYWRINYLRKKKDGVISAEVTMKMKRLIRIIDKKNIALISNAFFLI